MGSVVVDAATPGRGADQPRLEDPGVTAAASDDDVVGARRAGELVDDGRDDGIGRDRARQVREDPDERLGLGPAAGLEVGDGGAVLDRRDADAEDERSDEEVDRAGAPAQRAGR